MNKIQNFVDLASARIFYSRLTDTETVRAMPPAWKFLKV